MMDTYSLPAIALLSLLLMGMDNAPREADERKQLDEAQTRLVLRIEELKKEQDFLLFQRSFSGSDSKYIILDLSAGRGTLKYRNRILRTFRLSVSSPEHRRIRKGRHVLASKTDGSPKKRALIVQDEFIIHGKGYAGRSGGERRMPGLVIGRKDLAALFFSVDKGTMLFIR
ncbi:MAG: hypothetical protein ACYC7L_03380 [Nitrospirota bacterium]